MHMLSWTNRNSAELETVRSLKIRRRLSQPTAKCKQKKKRPCMSENWLTRDSQASRRHTSHLENSAKITGRITIRPVVRNYISSKTAERPIATRRTTYLSLSLVYRQALQAQLHRHLPNQCYRKQLFSHCIPHQQDARVRVAQHG